MSKNAPTGKPVIMDIDKVLNPSENKKNKGTHTTQATQEPDISNSVLVEELQEDFYGEKDMKIYSIAQDIIACFDITFLEAPEKCGYKLSWFNDRYWEFMSKEKMKGLIYSYLDEDNKYNTSNINKVLDNIWSYVFYECYNDYLIYGSRFTDKDFRKVANRIVFKNCVYDVKEQKIYGFDKSLPYTFGLNIPYKKEDEDTPAYDQICGQATGYDKDSMKLINYMIAYLCIPNRSGKCMFFLSPARDSGKSLLILAIEKIFPDGMTSRFSPESMGGRFALSCVDGPVLLTCPEMSKGALPKAACAELKRITGEEKLYVEKKRVDAATVTNRCKIIMASNWDFNMGSHFDAALMRRVIAVPFLFSAPADKLDYSLSKKLQKEMPYVVSRAARKMHKIIDKKGGIIIPESSLSKKIKASWGPGDDHITDFITKYLRRSKKTTSFIWKRDIYDVYKSYVNLTDSNAVIADKKVLYARIKDEFSNVRSTRHRIKGRNKDAKDSFEGIEWSSNVDIPPEYTLGCR